MQAPDKPQDLTIHFEKGLPVRVTSEGQEWTDSLELFIALNAIGKKHGVGRIDIVENRYVGIKSRGCYDSPAMTIVSAPCNLAGCGAALTLEIAAVRPP